MRPQIDDGNQVIPSVRTCAEGALEATLCTDHWLGAQSTDGLAADLALLQDCGRSFLLSRMITP